MTYNDDLTWAKLSDLAAAGAETTINALIHGLELYNEWQSFRAGRTNLQISLALAKTEANVADMDACFAAFKELHDCAANVAVSQLDRLFAMRKFS